MKNYSLEDLKTLNISINKPSLIFLYWDLGSWKTTLSKHIINNILWKNWDIVSPTYTYYNNYDDVIHFDLYRLKDYDEFFAIWWEDILDNNTWVILIEWPQLLEKYYEPDLKIFLTKSEHENMRNIELEYKK